MEARDISDEAWEQVLVTVAARAAQFAHYAGVGAMETAGGLISYLIEHPRDIRPFINGGIPEIAEDWFQRGRLTWMGTDGKVHRPEDARLRKIAAKMNPAKRRKDSQ